MNKEEYINAFNRIMSDKLRDVLPEDGTEHIFNMIALSLCSYEIQHILIGMEKNKCNQ